MRKRLLPAYPLMVKDPYFSLWSFSDTLNGAETVFWTGEEKSLYGIISVNNVLYCFLGKLDCIEQAEQLSVNVTAFSTDYTFRAGEAKLSVRFVSPLPPDDPRLIANPVCYVTYTVEGAEKVQVYLMLRENVCYNRECPDKRIRGGRVQIADGMVSFFGLARQFRLSNNEDLAGADWGYYYLYGQDSRFAAADTLPARPAGCRSVDSFLLATSRKPTGVFLLAYDDTVSIDYFGDLLRGNEHTILHEIGWLYYHLEEVEQKLAAFDRDLKERSDPFGGDYYRILCASLRQSVGAHKLVYDREGNLLFLSKECGSNGCIATVDVSYPSIPLYLLYNPELVRGMLRPILRFASMPIWCFNFAPHDVGTYPTCIGQVYGLRDAEDAVPDLFCTLRGPGRGTRFPIYILPNGRSVYRFENQMPIEESANMLIMLAAAYCADGKLTLTEQYFPLLNRWADYLCDYGLRPFRQLCTDDFGGHLSNNINLAIKAAVGLGSFSILAKAMGKENHARYLSLARRFGEEICRATCNGRIPLTYESGGETYSLKYNMLFDKLLSLGIFPREVYDREIKVYISQLKRYGIPLDSRKTYTKSDWEVWTACLTDDKATRRVLLRCISDYLTESESRVPFSDWYDAATGVSMGFRNRTVQGGCFALLLCSFYEKRKKQDPWL